MTRRLGRRPRVSARRAAAVVLGAGLAAAGLSAQAQDAPELPFDRITLPPGFSIEVYAEGLQNPRHHPDRAVRRRTASASP